MAQQDSTSTSLDDTASPPRQRAVLSRRFSGSRFKRKPKIQDPASLSQVRPMARRQRIALIFTIWSLVVALCGWLDPKPGSSSGSIFENAENYTYSARMAVYARRHADIARWAQQQIVLVPLSDDTFDKEWGAGYEGPPVKRYYHAKVVRDLTRAGVRLIAFDLVFDQQGEGDSDFAAAVRDSGRVVWGCLLRRESEDDLNSPYTVDQPTPLLLKAGGSKAHILTPQSTEKLVVDRVTAFESVHDPTQTNRKSLMPAFSVQAALQSMGLAKGEMAKGKIGKGEIKRTIYGWEIGGHTLPVDERGDFNISFLGKPGDNNGGGFFPSVPYEQIYEGAVDDPFYKQNHFFKNKIVIIGDTTKLGNDFRFTPVGNMAGMEAQAHATATVLAALLQQQRPISEAPHWLNLLMIGLVAALSCRFAAAWRLHISTISMLLLLCGYGLLSVWFFTEYDLHLHVIAPAAAALLATLGVMTERSLTEERQKNFMRSLLGRYVSPHVADYLAADPERLKLGGQRVTASVLFSDIRGFTQISRQLEAEQVVTLLNDYLQAMTDIVFKHEGTLDKYIGDGIMAVFGAPHQQKDHARRAVATAIDMLEALKEVQEQWRVHDLPPFEIGIAIASGDMIAGNMGTRQKMDFTVMGDVVNLSSRIEGVNKRLRTRLLIHDSTYQYVNEEILVRGPLPVSIRGHEDAEVLVYEVLGWK